MELLDYMACKMKCNISDMRYGQFMWINIYDIEEIEDSLYSVEEWKYAAEYITGRSENYNSVEEIKRDIIHTVTERRPK